MRKNNCITSCLVKKNQSMMLTQKNNISEIYLIDFAKHWWHFVRSDDNKFSCSHYRRNFLLKTASNAVIFLNFSCFAWVIFKNEDYNGVIYFWNPVLILFPSRDMRLGQIQKDLWLGQLLTLFWAYFWLKCPGNWHNHFK